MDQNKHVYLDHAATTPLAPEVLEAMMPYLQETYGNPGSFHSIGKQANDAVIAAREGIAELLACRSDEILFTSGGTESDNLAILGYARAMASKGKHLVTTSIEHHAVLEAMQHLERKEGFELTIVPVEKNGIVNAQAVLDVIREDTTIVSVMLVNNEIGTIQPVADIGRAIEKKKQEGHAQHVAFHTDACQAAAYLDLDVRKLHVDLLSLNGSKVYGPKGSGLLYVKRGVKLTPLQFGGAQERGLRPGTENVAGSVGLCKALQLAVDRREEDTDHSQPLQARLIDGVLSTISKTRLNGDRAQRIPNNVNISFMDLEGEALLLYLDAVGVYASTGSACTSASLDPSHVILALGMPFEVAHGSMRFSLGRSTTMADIEYLLEVLPPLVERLRAMSPVCVDEKYFELEA
ncbi:cysteine desulfurase NifS [Candidatus Uhrbacteria bacterium CG10_big_fil_rev_8_21_14_0_10_50_16]|uniref:Cysteine desulfurase NifS n=1 Tax=Candidatus Uhrbacteria bacterium CG10_big_fil_rev_8_21_14_0_10_50_16 TaxID=1975039 RepID=A0A2H0RLV9_9BACT|nr:MAG: cysteine desulfurase NifS [Candidatus Uhrbacteria bacterium CG10_big_fil_rev_8_21_14_0_10_50_16]